MSKLTDSFRTVGIYNPHGFYDVGNVYIAYSANEYGRSAHFSVHRPGYRTDPNGHWRDYGNKSFSLFGHGGTHAERKAAALKDAQAWAGAKYGITEWAKDPYGCWGEAGFVKARTAELKRLAKQEGGVPA